MTVHVTEIELAFRADHPDRLTISYDLLRIQQGSNDLSAPLLGYDPEELLISGPELLLLVTGLTIGHDGRLAIAGVPLKPWYEATDRSFACIAPMLEGTMRIVAKLPRLVNDSGRRMLEPNDRAWEWSIGDGILRERSMHTDPSIESIIKPFK